MSSGQDRAGFMWREHPGGFTLLLVGFRWAEWLFTFATWEAGNSHLPAVSGVVWLLLGYTAAASAVIHLLVRGVLRQWWILLATDLLLVLWLAHTAGGLRDALYMYAVNAILVAGMALPWRRYLLYTAGLVVLVTLSEKGVILPQPHGTVVESWERAVSDDVGLMAIGVLVVFARRVYQLGGEVRVARERLQTTAVLHHETLQLVAACGGRLRAALRRRDEGAWAEVEEAPRSLAQVRRCITGFGADGGGNDPWGGARRMARAVGAELVVRGGEEVPSLELRQLEFLRRALSEAVANACRHAGAARVLLEVRCAADGIEVAAVPQECRQSMAYGEAVGGRGLDLLRQEAALLGGDVELAGNVLRLRLPRGRRSKGGTL